MAAPCDPKYPDPSTYTRPPGFDIKISGSPKNYGRPFWIDLNKVEGTDGPWLGFCDEGGTRLRGPSWVPRETLKKSLSFAFHLHADVPHSS